MTDVFGDALAGAAKGAALGSVVPGVGTAIGAVGGLAMGVAPSIGRWLFGAEGEQAAQQIAAAAEAVTGAADPDMQMRVLERDPAAADAFRVQVLRIAAEREAAADQAANARLEAALADVADARRTMLTLTQAGNPLAWGAAVVTLIILGLFGFVIFHGAPVDADLKETLKVLSVAAASYWIGSSAGSANKDRRLAARADG